jgi:hypothetical protein
MTEGLVVAPCSAAAARWAIENWHYSRRMPVGKTVRLGVWEGGRFTGAVLFSWGMNHNLSKQFGLEMTECCELVRVALEGGHQATVTEVVAQALRLLRRISPGIRVVVSFADPMAGHVGRIYQAGNWLYMGRTVDQNHPMLGTQVLNRRAFTGHNYGSPAATLPEGARWVRTPGKHRYVMPMDKAMRRRLVRQAQPYPAEP